MPKADATPPATGGSAPAAFVEHREGACFLLVSRELEAPARALGLLRPGGLAGLLAGAEGPRGRGRNAVLALSGRSERLHLRPLQHGGILARVLRDRLLGVARPAAELRVTAALLARGAPVPQPALAAAERSRGFWRAALATIHVESARDGEAFLRSGPEPQALLRACAAAGRAVRAFHEAGGRHRDLSVANLLLRARGSDLEVLVIDLDRARAGAPPSPAARMAELMRLHRSCVKRGFASRVGTAGRNAFLDAYVGGDSRLEQHLRARLPRARRRLRWHRLGYRLRGIGRVP